MRFYADDNTRVVAGLMLATLGLGCIAPLIAAITIQMIRMEGRPPVLAFAQLAAGSVTAVLLVVPILIMTITGFRPERDPELTVMLNDLAWLLFLTPIAPFIVQNVVSRAGSCPARRHSCR